jgi:3',5'-cyclic AMP phosphodiesterase CpdA
MISKFVVISDTHFFAPEFAPDDKLYWNRVLQSRSPEIAECLIQTISEIAPDFVVHCGDFTGLCDLENFDYGCRVMDRLPCPWYAAVGNHDTWYPGIRSAFSARFGLPEGQCHYRRELAGLHFIFLDVAYWTSSEGHVSPYLDKDLYDSWQILGMGPTESELKWLETELEQCGEQPVILVSHAPLGFKDAYPLATLPKGRPVQAATTSLVDHLGDVLLREQMRAIIGRFPTVRAAFAGHWHIHDVTDDDGVLYCQTASLREYPFEIRIVQVEDRKLSLATQGLKDPAFQRLSYVAEWGNSWVAGSASDRALTLDLR